MITEPAVPALLEADDDPEVVLGDMTELKLLPGYRRLQKQLDNLQAAHVYACARRSETWEGVQYHRGVAAGVEMAREQVDRIIAAARKVKSSK